MRNPFKYGKICNKWYPVIKLEFRVYGLCNIKLLKIIKVNGRFYGLTIFKNDIMYNRSFMF
jgi:hypothetical protein